MSIEINLKDEHNISSLPNVDANTYKKVKNKVKTLKVESKEEFNDLNHSKKFKSEGNPNYLSGQLKI